MQRVGIRSEWDARPRSLRLFFGGSVIVTVVSVVRDPSALGFPTILFTVFFLALLKKLWDGERAMWRLFVIVSGAGLVAALTSAFDEPAAWAGVAAAAVGLMLLVTESTRAWVAQESDSPVP